MIFLELPPRVMRLAMGVERSGSPGDVLTVRTGDTSGNDLHIVE
jgi:hypothetical protein